MSVFRRAKALSLLSTPSYRTTTRRVTPPPLLSLSLLSLGLMERERIVCVCCVCLYIRLVEEQKKHSDGSHCVLFFLSSVCERRVCVWCLRGADSWNDHRGTEASFLSLLLVSSVPLSLFSCVFNGAYEGKYILVSPLKGKGEEKEEKK